MSKSRENYKFTGTVLLLLLVLVLAIGSFSIWNYLRVNSITESLAQKEARGLVFQVERELENAAMSESVTLNLVADHLFSAAYLARRMIIENPPMIHQLDVLAADAGIHNFEIFDKQNRFIASNDGRQSISTDMIRYVNNLYDEEGLQEFTIGFYNDVDNGTRNFAVTVDYKNGGLILAGYDAEDLIAWREELGFGAILRHLEDHPEVSYALMVSKNGILAATSDLPEWLKEKDLLSFDRDEEIQSGFIKGDERNVFEVVKSLDILDGVWLRVGLESNEINQIRKRNLNSLILRSLLFIILAGASTAVIILRQNQKVLIRESQRIKREMESLEADKRASERLEAMGKLAGGVAHEIRNPLNTVEIVAQRLKIEFEPKEDQEEYLNLVKTMRSEAGRISKIVQDFLNFARPPKTEVRLGSLDDLIGKMETLFGPVASNKGADFVINHRVHKSFFFDEEQLRQALQNLLRNAFEAIPDEDGKVVLETRDEKDFVDIEVRDNGPGIPEEERVRIFHLYYTTKAEGTGIGLSLVHRIADEHGGRVIVQDATEGGASITMQLKK